MMENAQYTVWIMKSLISLFQNIFRHLLFFSFGSNPTDMSKVTKSHVTLLELLQGRNYPKLDPVYLTRIWAIK